MMQKKKVILIATVVVFVLVVVFAKLYSSGSTPNNILSTNNLSNLSPVKSSNSNVYESEKYGFIFNLPDDFRYLGERKTNNITYLGFGLKKESEDNNAYLKVIVESKGYIPYKKCNELNVIYPSPYSCIDSEVEYILLGDKRAESFYLSDGINNSYHVVRTTEEPHIVLEMHLAEGGFDKKFSQVIESFSF